MYYQVCTHRCNIPRANNLLVLIPVVLQGERKGAMWLKTQDLAGNREMLT